MDTEKSTRVTRAEAAEIAGVSERTISRWAAKGLLGKIRRPPSGSTRPVTYEIGKVLAEAERRGRIEDLVLPEEA